MDNQSSTGTATQPTQTAGLSATTPRQDIFDAQKTKVEDNNKQNSVLQDKKQIVASHRGFPKNLVFVLIGILVLLIVIALIAKIFLPGISGSRQATITWWSLEEDLDAVTPLINEYQAQNPNVKINFFSQSQQDYRERLVNAIAKGQGPDIFQFHNSWIPMFASNLSVTSDD